MLKVCDVIEKVGKEYEPMLKKISIPDFYKTIAVFSGLQIQDVNDDSMLNYLTLWCQHKKRFFDLMGGKTKIDIPFIYVDEDRDYESKYKELGHKYPAFYYWFKAFNQESKNKITNQNHNYSWRDDMRELFPSISSLEGMTITSFFKRCLNAPDEIVTEVGRIYENNEVKANFTISIDPVDMMLASENPYGWNSCYRLEPDNDSSHADGCLAAVIDHDSLITYVWNNEGKFKLYNYDLKSIRYKRMRMWIAISENCHSVHFNTIYPGKCDYSDGMRKQIRDVVETFICNSLNVPNMWKHNDYSSSDNVSMSEVHREYNYGYSEFSDNYIYNRKDVEPEDIWVYDREIVCPCGCGGVLPGTDDCDEECYQGGGHRCENYYEDRNEWEDWRVYDGDDYEVECFDYEDDAIDYCNERGYKYVEHHWGDDWDSDYERVYTNDNFKEEDEEEEDSDQEEETTETTDTSKATTITIDASQWGNLSFSYLDNTYGGNCKR